MTGVQTCALPISRFDSELAVELLLVIAVRQAEQDAASAAAVTLAALDELVMGKAKKHELLLLDVLRLAKQYDAALNLERSLYKRDELDSVRFGDLLRDTARVDGEAEALTLLDQLLEKSLDDDLLGAAIELQSDNLPLNDRIDQLRTQNQAAAAEYKERSAAAGKRDKIRNQWSAASAAPPKLMKR